MEQWKTTVLDTCLSTPAMNLQMAIDTVATLPSGRRLAECNHESRWRKKREAVHNVSMHAPDIAMEGPLTLSNQMSYQAFNSAQPRRPNSNYA